MAVACVTHYEPDFRCLARMGRIVDARMAKRKSKSQPAWTDVKAKLADFDRAALLGLIQSLYTAHKDNQTFLHARFGLSEDVLEPYKKTIDRWLWPDLFRKQAVSQAKRAISDEGSWRFRGTSRVDGFLLRCPQRPGIGYQQRVGRRTWRL